MLRRTLMLLLALSLAVSAGLAEGFWTITSGDATPKPTATPAPTAAPETPAPEETEANQETPVQEEQPEETAVPAEETAQGAVTPSPERETRARWCDSQPYGLRNGPRDAKRIAITMDDCYERDKVRECFDLITRYGGVMTFFPCGDQLKKSEADLWREIASSGCEIGSHTMHHTGLTEIPGDTVWAHISRFQETLDDVLGYHYGVVSMRPPFGHYRIAPDTRVYAPIRKSLEKFNIEHVVLWDVSQTNFATAKKQVKNGSILLYHAREHDMKCLRQLIPWLAEQGYEFVTTRELLDLPEIEISNECYVHRK